MTLTKDDLERLLVEGASQTVDFRSWLSEPGVAARVINAMANTEGGTILVGVGDKGQVTGANAAYLQKVYKNTLTMLRPTPRTSLQFFTFGGRQVGVIEVEKSPGLVLGPEIGAFARVDGSVRPMPTEAIIRKLPPGPSAEQTAMAEAIATLTTRMLELNARVDYANSIRGQMPNYLIGGIIGAILGAMLAWLLKLLM